MASPTFVARFLDGEIARMTTYCEDGKFDFPRGVILAQHAYRSRTGREPPAITLAHFEDAVTGDILERYETGLAAD
jgi:hypothetical protein